MNRSDARAAAAAALIATGSYTVGGVDQVYQGATDAFGGRSPTAVILSTSLRLDLVARELYTIESGLSVSIYVRQADSTAASAAAAESLLDDLIAEAALALHATGNFEVGQSDAAPEGAPRRSIDGVIYRVERLPLTVLDEGAD